MKTKVKLKPADKALEDKITHVLSEWLNDSAPIGEEMYRGPAKAVIKYVVDAIKAPRKKTPKGRSDG